MHRAVQIFLAKAVAKTKQEGEPEFRDELGPGAKPPKGYVGACVGSVMGIVVT